MTQVCELLVFNICFVKPIIAEYSIFGFSEFITAFSLFMVLFTLTDINYKFRILTTPTLIKKFSLVHEIFFINILIAIGTLLSDTWFEQSWLIANCLKMQIYWQILLAISFVFSVFSLIWYIFVKPSVFCKKNYKNFSKSLYEMVINSSSLDLSIIAKELNRSAKNIIKYSATPISKWQNDDKENKQIHKPDEINGYAHDILMLIGYRKLCKSIVSDTPITAIIFLEEAAKSKKELPIGTFLRNIATEAFLNKNSNLYHEDNVYNSGLIGYIRPFNKAVFGNCELIGGLPLQSPFDLDYNILKNFDSEQLAAYTRALFIFIDNCLENDIINKNSTHFSIFNIVLENIIRFSSDAYKLNNITDLINNEIYKKINVISDFFKVLIEKIEKKNKEEKQNLKKKIHTKICYKSYNGNYGNYDYFDLIAESIMKFLINIASVKEPSDTNLCIQYTTVWCNLFHFPDKNNITQRIIHYRLCHLIYLEINDLKNFNYRSTKILGLCLNVMGFIRKNDGVNSTTTRALHKFILDWTQNNYLKLRKINNDLAEDVLTGNISFDEKENRLINTYNKGLNNEPPKNYLILKD